MIQSLRDRSKQRVSETSGALIIAPENLERFRQLVLADRGGGHERRPPPYVVGYGAKPLSQDNLRSQQIGL